MKKIILILCVALMAASCGVSNKTSKKKYDIVVGVCHNGVTETTKGYFRKCVNDAGADIVFFPEYTSTDEMAREYVAGVDAVIIPGSTAGDTTGRKQYDNRVVQATLDAGKPILGICYGHQRISKVMGGEMKKVADAFPESEVVHKNKVDDYNIGLNTEAHPMIVDPESRLYRLLGGLDTVMVNTSHNWCVTEAAEGLKVVGVAPDGLIEAYEAEYITGVQFHPEYLYGKMGIERFRAIFDELVREAKEVKYGK